MSAPKHTPAPWEAKGSVHGWTVYGPATDEHAEPGELELVCDGATRANAALIVAAPELLRALKDVLDERHAGSDHDCAICMRAFAAIAKACAHGR